MFMDHLQKDERIPAVEGWSYTSSAASLAFSDSESMVSVEGAVRKLGYEFRDLDKVLEERRPTRIYSGLITAPTSKLTLEQFGVIIKRQAEDKKIEGLLRVVDLIPTGESGNCLLRIRADEHAIQGLKSVESTLRIAMAGRVLFTDQRDRMSLSKQEIEAEESRRRLKDAEAKVILEKAKLATYEARKEHDKLSSVGSGGLTHLTIEADAVEDMLLDPGASTQNLNPSGAASRPAEDNKTE